MLILSCLVVPTSSAEQSPRRTFSTHGNVSYESESVWVRKTVTWGDGTVDTLEIAKDGAVYLNGVNTIAFGFHIVTDPPGSNTEAIRRKILDTCASWGIRFMSLDLSSWKSTIACLAWIDWWMPELYQRKMFVEFAMQESPAGNLDVSTQISRFNSLIDLIDNSTWANMIYAATYAWELDLGIFAHNSAQLHAYLTEITPLIKGKLASSLLGNIPLMCKMVSPQDPYGSDQFFEHCELVGYDYYVDPTTMPGHCNERFDLYRQYNAINGKSGYHIWLQEQGVQPQYGANWRPYDPAQFQYVIGGAGLGDVSELMIWCLNWDTTGYQFPAFDFNGDPYAWILGLVPHFP